ncbi:hypothetical protein U1Q18_024816 [Sarracenia purpurea var. burkii]
MNGGTEASSDLSPQSPLKEGPRTPGPTVSFANVARKEGAIRIPTQGGWIETGEVSYIQIRGPLGPRHHLVSRELMWGYGFGPLSLCWFSSRHMQVYPLSSTAWSWSSAAGVYMRSSRWCGQCCCGKWVAGFWKLSCSSFLGAGGVPCEVTMVVSLIALLLQVVQASQVKWYLAIPGCSSYHFVVWVCTYNLAVALR